MIQQVIQYPALIKYLKGFSNYSWVHYCDGRKVLIAKSLCYFEKHLPAFFRIHKTALVNPHYITDFTAPPGHKMSGSVRISDGVVLPVSRRRWNQIIDPMTVALLQSTSSFQSGNGTESLMNPVSAATPAPKRIETRPARRMWLGMADEMKSGLLRQVIRDRWSQWLLQGFETSSRLQKELSATADPEMPAMIILDGSESRSIQSLQAIKNNPRFRFIPTILLVAAENHNLVDQGYTSGANSVIVYSSDLTRFIQALEKTFRYWLSTASAPYVAAKGGFSLI